MDYKMIDITTSCRKVVFLRSTEECRRPVFMTAGTDVTDPAAYFKRTGTKFCINFLKFLAVFQSGFNLFPYNEA